MAKCVELGSSNIIVGGDMNTNLHRANSDFTRQLNLLCEVDNFTLSIAKLIIHSLVQSIMEHTP